MKEKKLKSKDITHSNIPATVGLVQEVRSELKADIRALSRKMDAGFAKIEARFGSTDSKFASMDSKFAGMDSKFEDLKAMTHRAVALMEEQRSENRIVLDGLKTMIDRQDRIEADVSDLRTTVEGLKFRST